VVQLFPGRMHRAVNAPSVNRLAFGVVQLILEHAYRVVCAPLVKRFVAGMARLTSGRGHWVVRAPVVNLSNRGVMGWGLVQPAPEHVHWAVYAPVANRLGLDKLVWVPQRLCSMAYP